MTGCKLSVTWEGFYSQKLRQNCAKIVFTHEKKLYTVDKVLIFVSGFLSISNVGKNGCKKSAKGGGGEFYG